MHIFIFDLDLAQRARCFSTLRKKLKNFLTRKTLGKSKKLIDKTYDDSQFWFGLEIRGALKKSVAYLKNELRVRGFSDVIGAYFEENLSRDESALRHCDRSGGD